MICGRQHQLIQQGRIRRLLGVKEHGMQSKVIKRTWETLLGLFFKKKYWPTRIKPRKSKTRVGSQIDHSTSETSNDGRGKDLR